MLQLECDGLVKLFRELVLAVFTLKKLALLFHLKTAAAHAVCHNFTTFIASICARFASEQLPAAFAPVVLFFTSTYEMLTGALLY